MINDEAAALTCPVCEAPRTRDQIDASGHCMVCGTRLLPDAGPDSAAEVGSVSEAGTEDGRDEGYRTVASPSPAGEVPAPAGDRGPASRATPWPPEPPSSPPKEPRPAPAELHPGSREADPPPLPGAASREKETFVPPPPPPARAAEKSPIPTAEGYRYPSIEEAPEPAAESPRDYRPPVPPSRPERPAASEPSASPARPDRPDPSVLPAEAWESPGEEGEDDPVLRRAREVEYERLVESVESNLREGYELFGLVGHASSGKSHALMAMTHLLDAQGVSGGKASSTFLGAAPPGQTSAQVYDYAYSGDDDERWTMLDAGGELYRRIQENDWETDLAWGARLARWLYGARGLFCFLHLQPEHFSVASLEPEIGRDGGSRGGDDEEVRRLTRREQRIAEAGKEIGFFKQLLLFLRALRAEGGDVGKVIEQCRTESYMDDALRDYETSPRLDIPVMFFFSKADSYSAIGRDFELAKGRHVNPRFLDRPVAPFVARHLPGLFRAVALQVEHFKFDFLQSYEEHPSGRRDERGNDIVDTYFKHPDHPDRLLSVGLMAGFEFLLRNPPEPLSKLGGLLPRLDSLAALRWHRRFHPDDWKGVPEGMLRPPRRSGDGGAGRGDGR